MLHFNVIEFKIFLNKDILIRKPNVTNFWCSVYNFIMTDRVIKTYCYSYMFLIFIAKGCFLLKVLHTNTHWCRHTRSHTHMLTHTHTHTHTRRKEGNVLFNDALNTFYLQLYVVGHMVKDHSDYKRGNPLPPHRLFFLISSKGYFICIIPQTG